MCVAIVSQGLLQSCAPSHTVQPSQPPRPQSLLTGHAVGTKRKKSDRVCVRVVELLPGAGQHLLLLPTGSELVLRLWPLTAAVSTKRYWLPRYAQANAATTVTKKLNMVTTTALTERTGEKRERGGIGEGQAVILLAESACDCLSWATGMLENSRFTPLEILFRTTDWPLLYWRNTLSISGRCCCSERKGLAEANH